jgi:hypothetical protein
MSEPDCSPEERLKQLLKILDTFCSNPSAAELQQLANEAKRVVNKMQNILERSLAEEVAELVQAEEWDEVKEKMKQNFPSGLSIGKVEEILDLVYHNGSVEHVVNAIHWVEELDVQLQSRAYEALYEHLKDKKCTNQPQVLLLWYTVTKMPVGQVSDKLCAQLGEDFQTIADQIADGIKKDDYFLQSKINKMSYITYRMGHFILNEMVPVVVGKFETITLEETLLLIQYSIKLPAFGNSCLLIDALMKMFEDRKMMDSEQSLQLWSYAKYTMEEHANWKYVSKANQQLCTDVLDKLNMHKLQFFQHYQKYVEDKDKQKIQKLHEGNWHLRSIVSEFVTWYYKKDDLTTVQNLLYAAREIDNFYAIERMLTSLQIEMHKFQQMNTFEAFRLFNEVKYNMEDDNYESQEPKLKASFEELKAKAPTCLRLLLWPDEDRLRLVNKFYDSPLGIQQENFLCSNSSLDTELLCRASIDLDTALTIFSFKSGTKRCKLDAAALEDDTAEKPWIGTQWKLKAIDDTHVKIFTDDGEWQFSFVAGLFSFWSVIYENVKF